MQSKNKKAPTVIESRYIAWLKEQSCVVCGEHGPSDAHEIKQGSWFTAVPLCKGCHQGPKNGIHGEKRMWILMKMDELDAVNKTVERFVSGVKF